MQERIFFSIVLISIIFIILLIGIILIMIRFYKSKEKHERELYSSVLLAEEVERERISRDIHDDLGGLITSSRLTLGSIMMNKYDTETITKLNHLMSVLEMASIAAKNVSLELSPEALSKYGLQGAIRSIPNLYKSFKGVFDIKCDDIELNSSVEIGIFRILSEVINNAVKYSEANCIYINVFIDENDSLNIKVGDNGKGFEVNAITPTSNGISNIKNRCKILNGQFNINTSLWNGCHYHLKFKKQFYAKK